MFVSIAMTTAVLAVLVGRLLSLRKAHGQFKKRIDRGCQIVRDSSQVEGELELASPSDKCNLVKCRRSGFCLHGFRRPASDEAIIRAGDQEPIAHEGAQPVPTAAL